jgi:hypothetical protein
MDFEGWKDRSSLFVEKCPGIRAALGEHFIPGFQTALPDRSFWETERELSAPVL